MTPDEIEFWPAIDLFLPRERHDFGQAEIDTMALRCGLLPRDEFLAKRQRVEGVPEDRGSGKTTQALLTALLAAEVGEVVLLVAADTRKRKWLDRELYRLAGLANIPHWVTKRYIRVIPPDWDKVLGIEFTVALRMDDR